MLARFKAKILRRFVIPRFSRPPGFVLCCRRIAIPRIFFVPSCTPRLVLHDSLEPEQQSPRTQIERPDEHEHRQRKGRPSDCLVRQRRQDCISGKKDAGNHSHCRRDAGRNHQACRETAAEQRKNPSKIAHHVTAELFVLPMPIGGPLGVDQHVTANKMFD